MMRLLTNRNAARSAARAKFKIDVQNACPPTASTLPLIGRTTAGPAGSSPTKTTPIDGARERGTTTAIGPSCRLARCTKVVRYLRYSRRAGRTAVIAVLDPEPKSAGRSNRARCEGWVEPQRQGIGPAALQLQQPAMRRPINARKHVRTRSHFDDGLEIPEKPTPDRPDAPR